MPSSPNSSFAVTARKRLNAFLRDESGVTALEYGMIIAVVSVILILGTSYLSGTLNNNFSRVTSNLE